MTEQEQVTGGPPQSVTALRSALVVMPILGRGGAERVLLMLARALAERPGWDVTILTLGACSGDGFDIGRARLCIGRGSGKFGAEWRIVPHVRGRQFDLVVSSHLRVNAALSLLRRLGVLRTERLVTRESTVIFDRVGGLAALAYSAIYAFYGGQDVIIAQTGYMQAALRRQLPRRLEPKIRVMPNPIDLATIEAGVGCALPEDIARRLAERPQIVWCGRFIAIKRPLAAIAAFDLLRREYGMDLGLIMIGDGPLREEAERAVEAAGLAPHVIMTGAVDNPWHWMAAARWGMLTSAREGFPNVILEMLACGIEAVVSTDCAGDLDQLPGVVLCGHEEGEIAAAVASLSGELKVCSGSVNDALACRDPAAFITALAAGEGDGPGMPCSVSCLGVHVPKSPEAVDLADSSAEMKP